MEKKKMVVAIGIVLTMMKGSEERDSGVDLHWL
jgi:hypothetical protein